MKQQILNLKKKLLLVEIPDNHHAIAVFPRSSFLTTWDKDNYTYTNKLDFNVEEIGKLTDITEEQFTEFAARFYGTEWDPEVMYRDFINDFHYFLTAKESFFSYLKKEGILFSNPLGPESDYVKTLLKSIGFKYNPGYRSWDNDKHAIGTPLLITDLPPSFDKEKKEWQEAEEKVWVLSRCYLFQII